jgi:hypothetical protein
VKCEINDCTARRKTRGLCATHYHKAWREGRLDAYPRSHVAGGRNCDVAGCERKSARLSRCDKHYLAALRRGELPSSKRCAAPGCDRFAASTKYCQPHYIRARKYGDPNLRKNAPAGTGFVRHDGYVTLFRPGHPNAAKSGRISEQRLMAAEWLGRPLCKGENVHHRNGNRGENTIGPCFLRSECTCSTRHNLELWVISQPSGQRASDKVAWAREIIALYGGV